MKMYLSALSLKNLGYTPDWLKVSYDRNGKDYEITFDIQGETDYSTNKLDCRVKGEIIPWTLYDKENGEEINLYLLSEEELKKEFSTRKIIEILSKGRDFRIGICPVVESNEINIIIAEEDILCDCKGSIEMYDMKQVHNINFTFETELNV